MNKQLAVLIVGCGIAIVLAVVGRYYGSVYSCASVLVAGMTVGYQYRCLKKRLQRK